MSSIFIFEGLGGHWVVFNGGRSVDGSWRVEGGT
jgi:hypothetical protein